MADDAGALLVRTGLVSDTALDDARSRVANLGGTVGEQLVWTGAIADDALTDFYRSRLLVPQVNPNTLARLPAKVVAAIPSDMAIELRAIPVALDNDNNLTVAMGDPSDRHAVDEIAFFTGAYVVRAVATQMQIAWCLAHYYGHVTALGQRLLQPSGAPYRGSPAVEPMPRKKGLTDQVDAARHRVVAPVTTPPPIPRPTTPGSPTNGEPVAAAPAVDVVDVEATPPLGTVDPAAPIETQDGDTEVTPDPPRARSISGEIRAVGRRAASVKPEVPEPADDDDEDAPVITMVVGGNDDDPTGPQMRPYRRRIKTDPPELAARAGEVDVITAPVAKVDLAEEEPRIVVEREALYDKHIRSLSGEIRAVQVREVRDDTPAPSTTIEVSDDASVIHDRYAAEDSAPILLNRRRPSDPTELNPRAPSDGGPDDDEVVVLDEARRKKPSTPPVSRSERRTNVGVGVFRGARDTEQSIPAVLDGDRTRPDGTAAPAGDETTTDRHAAPTPVVDDDTNPRMLAAPPARAATPPPIPRAKTPAPVVEDEEEEEEQEEEEDDRGHPTAVMTAVELDDAIPARKAEVLPAHIEARRQIDYDPLDDGWGPPGTTIPPPLLGAVPGTEDEDEQGAIPMPDVDSAPLMVTPPAPPETTRSNPHITLDPTNRGLVRAIEDATSRAIDLIRILEHATGRDQVIAAMVAHLAETHRRAGFFSIKASELSVFQILPRPPTLPAATLRLDRPSTLQDIVDTRLPYRGPMHDDASRTFLNSVLGATPPEILLVPVAIRERVVGVLFGEHRLRHTFDDQLALAARAAGMALERILKSRRS